MEPEYYGRLEDRNDLYPELLERRLSNQQREFLDKIKRPELQMDIYYGMTGSIRYRQWVTTK